MFLQHAVASIIVSLSSAAWFWFRVDPTQCTARTYAVALRRCIRSLLWVVSQLPRITLQLWSQVARLSSSSRILPLTLMLLPIMRGAAPVLSYAWQDVAIQFNEPSWWVSY